jgi:AP-2 complex subunit beta-1
MSAPVAGQSLLVDPEADEGGVDVDGGGEVGSDEGEAEEHLRPNGGGMDPYAALGSAFGNQMTDEPKSMGNGSASKHGDEDDLLAF